MNKSSSAWLDRLDPHTPLTRRFGVEVVDISPANATAKMTMPMANLLNPLTNLPAIGPLAFLADTIGGLTNHLRCLANQWTVTTELSLEMLPGAAEHLSKNGGSAVTAEARHIQTDGRTSLSSCTLTCGHIEIGSASVRSYFLGLDRVAMDLPPDRLPLTSRNSLADLMAVQIDLATGENPALRQLADPVVNNASGVVNGGIASAALEMTASAVMMEGGTPMHTASIHVNFLRPFIAGEHSVYRATPVRTGSGTAVADAQAVAAHGRPALVARVTAYR